MKKGITLFITIFMLLNFVYGEVNNDAVNNIRKVRSLSGLFTKTQVAKQNLEVEKVSQKAQLGSGARQVIINQSSKSSSRIITRDLLKGSLHPSKIEKLGFAEYDTLKLVPGTTTQVEYTAGETIVFLAITNEPMQLEFFVDNGDGVFGDGDRIVNMGEDGEPIIIFDGDEMDETPSGDGVIMFHLNTSQMVEGPGIIFNLQGVKIHIIGVQVSSGTHAFASVNILPIYSGNSYSGRVTLEGGVPAPFQLVLAVVGIDLNNPSSILATLTDANGDYFIGFPKDLTGIGLILVVDIWGDYSGLWPDPNSRMVPIGGQISSLNFILKGGSATISGYVLTNDRMPVPNVEVEAILVDNEMFRAKGITDANGYYEISVIPGYWEVNIVKESLNGNFLAGYYWEVLSVAENQTATRIFTVYPCDGFISGTVRFSNNVPVAGAYVFAEIWFPDKAGNWLDYWTETKTDHSGNYLLRISKDLQRIVGNDTMGYYVGAWYENAMVYPGGYNNVLADASGLDFVVYITDVIFSGKVFNMDNRMPLPDAGVRVYSLSGGTTVENWVYTNQEGYFEIGLLGKPAGQLYNVEIYWPYQYYQPVLRNTLLAYSNQNYYMEYFIQQISQTTVVEGRVDEWYPGYSGIYGALVEFWNQTFYFNATTDGFGFYRISDIPVGEYQAKASAPGYIPIDFPVRLGPDYNQINFTLQKEAIKLSGVVQDKATTTPLSNSMVFIENIYNGWNSVAITDEQGYFEFQVDPGLYNMMAGHNGYKIARTDSLEINASLNVIFALEKAAISGNLTGHIVDVNYNPIKGAWIFVESDDYLAFGITNDAGYYEVPLMEGYYHAIIGADGFHEEHRWFNFPGSSLEDPIILFELEYIYGPKLISVVDIPLDQGKQVRLTWKNDPNLEYSVKEFQVWRAVQRVNGPEPGKDVKQFSWDFVATVPFHRDFAEYNFVAPTLYDKVGDDIYWTAFMVTAVSWDGWTCWDSNIKAGWSEDNLPPEVPKNLAGNRVGNQIVLKWEEVTSEKIKYYTVYRKVGTGEFNRLAYTTKPEFGDTDVAINNTYFYSITATDFGLNESQKSAPVGVAVLSNQDTAPVPDKYNLSQNFPNPFNPSTRIDFGLPKHADVKIVIYNLMGQEIKDYQMNLSAGYHSIVWDGRDRNGNLVGTGIYIYTMSTPEFKQSRKMILIR